MQKLEAPSEVTQPPNTHAVSPSRFHPLVLVTKGMNIALPQSRKRGSAMTFLGIFTENLKCRGKVKL